MNLEVNTTRFGVVEVPADRVLLFQRGLIGFEPLKRYVLLDSRKAGGIQWLQSLDRPEVAFLVSDPRLLLPGFRLQFQEESDPRQDLGDAASLGEVGVYTILHVDREAGQIHVHVQSPLLIHAGTRRGVQIVTDADSPTVPVPAGSRTRPAPGTPGAPPPSSRPGT